MLGPRIPMMTRVSRRPGNAACASAKRMMKPPTTPCLNPARIPSVVPTVPARTTTDNPIIKLNRAPKIVRDKMSRPRASAPSMCRHDPPFSHTGGWWRSTRATACGDSGTRCDANSATNNMMTTKRRLTRKRRSLASASTNRERRVRVGRSSVETGSKPDASAEINARIHNCVQHVRHEIDADDDQRANEDRSLNQNDVLVQRRLQQKLTYAWPAKDTLDNDRTTADRHAELPEEHRDDREQPVSKNVLSQDLRLAEATGPKRRDVRRTELSEHDRAGDLRQSRSHAQGERDRGQNEMIRRSDTRRWQPAKPDCEDQDQNGSD